MSGGRNYVPTGRPRGRPRTLPVRPPSEGDGRSLDELIWQRTPKAMGRFLADLQRLCPPHEDAKEASYEQ